MAKTLIAFATSYGHTETIARRIAEFLQEPADVIAISRFRRKPPVAGYDRVIVAGSVIYGRHQRRLERYVRANRAALDAVDNALVSVSSSANHEESRGDAEEYVAELTRRTGWKPRRVLLAGGATSFTRYPFFLRRRIQKIEAAQGHGADVTRDYVYTDWAAVEAFVRALSASPTAGG
jgi:menaquinone-dependent protoporphyrinogen oxidase